MESPYRVIIVGGDWSGEQAQTWLWFSGRRSGPEKHCDCQSLGQKAESSAETRLKWGIAEDRRFNSIRRGLFR